MDVFEKASEVSEGWLPFLNPQQSGSGAVTEKTGGEVSCYSLFPAARGGGNRVKKRGSGAKSALVSVSGRFWPIPRGTARHHYTKQPS